MTPHDTIRSVLERVMDMHDADEMSEEILAQIAAQGFVVVQADRVIQQAGKVSVTRELVESVLEDAEALVNAEYVVDGEVHPANRRRYRRDMADILDLRAELQEARDA